MDIARGIAVFAIPTGSNPHQVDLPLCAVQMVRSAFADWSGHNLTRRSAEPDFTLFFSGEQLVYIVFGLALPGIASANTHHPQLLDRAD